MEQHSLEVYSEDNLIFQSTGKWLHPLFELEDFLKTSDFHPESLYLKDKIIGKAAALIIVYLNIKNVYGELMSELGKAVFEKYKIQFEFNTLVDRIACKTEKILEGDVSPEEAYEIIRKRANRP